MLNVNCWPVWTYCTIISFFRTLHRIAGLEGSLSSMHSLLSSKAAVICDLVKHGPLSGSLQSENSGRNDLHVEKWESLKIFPTKMLEKFDALLVDQNSKEAFDVLKHCDLALSEAKIKGVPDNKVRDLQASVKKRWAKLINHFINITQDECFHRVEIHFAITSLDQLGESLRAHELLLGLHGRRIQYAIKTLHPCGTLYGGLYTAALSQAVFSGVAQAVKDTSSTLKDCKGHASKTVLWACKETEKMLFLLKKHVLLVSSGLHAAVECIRIAYGHCLLLESRGLALCPLLCKILGPTVVDILHGNLEHIKETVTSLTAADDWVLTHAGATREVIWSTLLGSESSRKKHSVEFPAKQKTLSRSESSRKKQSVEFPVKLSVSAYQLNMLVQDFASDAAPLVKMHMGETLMNDIMCLFDAYMNLLLKALPSSVILNYAKESQILVQRAKEIQQQIAVLSNAKILADYLFPHAVWVALTGDKLDYQGPLFVHRGQRQDLMVCKIHFQKALMNIQNIFSKYHEEEFLAAFSAKITSDIYIGIEQHIEHLFTKSAEWMPSVFFKELCMKLHSIIEVAKLLLPAWEAVLSFPLMKIIKGVLTWLKNNGAFWKAFEEPIKPLRPEGCVQFIFDLHFVIQFALNGGFFSKALQGVVSDLMCGAQNCYAENGSDIGSAMPSDDWFTMTSQKSLEHIISQLGKMV